MTSVYASHPSQETRHINGISKAQLEVPSSIPKEDYAPSPADAINSPVYRSISAQFNDPRVKWRRADYSPLGLNLTTLTGA